MFDRTLPECEFIIWILAFDDPRFPWQNLGGAGTREEATSILVEIRPEIRWQRSREGGGHVNTNVTRSRKVI